MAKEKPTTKTCKHCKTEIPYEAKVCPQCRKKQGTGCLTKILIFLTVIIVLGMFGGSDEDSETTNQNESASTQEEKIEYKKVSVKKMMDALDKNPAKASNTYKDEYLEITGRLEVIDSDMSYISVHAEKYDIFGVKCYIMSEEQKETILEMEIGQEITVQGKCTDVGEIVGYFMDIDNIK